MRARRLVEINVIEQATNRYCRCNYFLSPSTGGKALVFHATNLSSQKSKQQQLVVLSEASQLGDVIHGLKCISISTRPLTCTRLELCNNAASRPIKTWRHGKTCMCRHGLLHSAKCSKTKAACDFWGVRYACFLNDSARTNYCKTKHLNTHSYDLIHPARSMASSSQRSILVLGTKKPVENVRGRLWPFMDTQKPRLECWMIQDLFVEIFSYLSAWIQI